MRQPLDKHLLIAYESNHEAVKQSLEKNNHKDAFLNAASPGVISAFLPNKFYKNDDEYLENLSNLMKDEYEEITTNGLKQLEDNIA